MSRYNNFFDSITPQTENAEFASAVIKGARESRKPARNIRRVISVSAAAAAVMALTVTASAVYNWDLGAAVRSFFGDRNNIVEESIVDATVTNAENSFENLDISVKGAVRDENFTVVFLDIERTDGGIIDCESYILKDADGNEMITAEGTTESLAPVYWFNGSKLEVTYANSGGGYYGTAEERSFSQCFVKDENALDSRVTMAICVDTSNPFFGYYDGEKPVCDKVKLDLGSFKGKKCTGRYSGDGKTIHLKDYSVLDEKGRYSCTVDVGSCETPVKKAASAETVTVKCFSGSRDISKFEYRDFDFEMNSLNVTPASVNVSLERDVPEETFYVERDGIGCVIMNDGSEVPFGTWYLPAVAKEQGNVRVASLEDNLPEKWTYNASFILPETVELSEVKAVRIGESEFTLS